MMKFIVSKQIIRFYSTPTFHRNLKKNIIIREIEKKIKNSNTISNKKYNTYNSYKNMYTKLPIKSNK
jgi:hypothetical protein